ncbi:Putative PAS domain, Zinc finger, GATA-type, Zinc finger, NHR/GATA-type, PAS domain superfamily [Septoria linicola]|uniref:PAS domain, Zinc finger, GATA-type, Zinc finger, NHR/GATA-type, PAS domain superfamily n=1 Tax=Septoria linicola TaxID=215465 RepID=A0A9Q9AZZ6_9PEZI|nr:Putative PAS domain, Zinc finger, GATA-type, Zinc finger, NHR/GATA-type, PAS domain superfamily [Septoria linicola]
MAVGAVDMGGLNSLDMSGVMDGDMNLPMDLDLDLSGNGDQSFNPIGVSTAPAPESNSIMASNGAGDYTPQGQHQQQDNNMSGAGAGPLPTGFGAPPQSNQSTLTEFTKRRNWSHRIIEELKDFLHILTPDGRILYVSPSCKTITGYEPHTLIGKFIGEYVHPDDSGIFMREFNESIASGNALRFFYRFKKEDGTYMIFECDGHPHISPEPAAPATFGQTPNGQSLPVAGLCRGFFMMARPYPTKNAALLDSFLEHKIENERLMRRIKELKEEEKEENAEQERIFMEQSSQAGATPAHSGMGMSREPESINDTPTNATPNYQGMPPPAKPPISNTALTRQNLDSALSSQKPDSIADKMSRYEANNTHLESIELLTGLRYRDGERSHGISTGDTSPALIRGDAGIAILLDRDREGAKKEKKKMKVADEYVCADCGTLDSPEWRKGPKGPKTLCNACGLRWAKKEKKRSGDDVKPNSPAPGMPNQQPLPHGLPMSLVGPGQPPGMPMQHSTNSSNSM